MGATNFNVVMQIKGNLIDAGPENESRKVQSDCKKKSSLTNTNRPRGRDPEDRLQERRRVRAQDANPLPPALLDVVRQPARAVGELAVCATEGLVVGGDMVDGGGLCGLIRLS